MIKEKGQQIKFKVHIFDVWLDDVEKAPLKPLRKIAIAANKNLYALAKVITQAFRFHFDHPFGFYNSFNNPSDSSAGYELFADIGEEPLQLHFKGVKKTKISDAFSDIGTKMLFLFDYGNEWHFIVELKETREPLPNESLPALLESAGEAPLQYLPPEKDAGDVVTGDINQIPPTRWNLVEKTLCEKIYW